MSSEITLDIGKFHLDWGQNEIFQNHSQLFLPSDKTTVEYYYVDDDSNDIIEVKEALVRRLIAAKERLELLGYSLKNVENLFEYHLNYNNNQSPTMNLTFNQFASSIINANISTLKTIKDLEIDVSINNEEFKEYISQKNYPNIDDGFEWYKNIRIKDLLENIDPYIILRLLMENTINHNLPLIWRYHDIIEGGYYNFEDIYTPLSDRQKYLIVTEGSTDTYILKESINFLKPDITDFFRFIDMEDNYPFTGSGNLFRFCQGLVSIGIHNKMIVVFDNDTEGIEKYNLTKKLKIPCQMIVMHLPDLDDFNEVECIGPNGHSIENINGEAVSIECFLDFKSTHYNPRIRWTSYNRNTLTYQGEIERKQEYIRKFKKLKNNEDYNYSKLRSLIIEIYDKCIIIPNITDEDI